MIHVATGAHRPPFDVWVGACFTSEQKTTLPLFFLSHSQHDYAGRFSSERVVLLFLLST